MASTDPKDPVKRTPRKRAGQTEKVGANPVPARFKTGARPPKDAPALAFAEFRRRREPGTYPEVDYLAAFDTWQVLGNDRAGDCLAVWWANGRRLVTGTLAAESYPDQDQVWELYRTQNPLFDPADPTSFDGPNDNGMEAQTLLEHLVKHGGPDGVKALGFAKVDHTDPDELKAAISTGGSLLLIVTVGQAQQDQFAAGAPWGYDEHSETEGQHAVLAGGHLDKTGGDLAIVTWGAETSLTDSYLANAAVQAWLVIWPEHLGDRQFLDGMDLDAFAAAYTDITGRPFPHRKGADGQDGREGVPDRGVDGAHGNAAPGPEPDGAVDHAALDSELYRALAPLLSGQVPSWQETFDMRAAVLRWAAGKEGEDLMTQEPAGPNPNTAHRADQQAQLDNEGEYLPSANARTRHLLQDAAEQADIRSAHQQEALDDLRQRESRTPVGRTEISKDDEAPSRGRADTPDRDRGHKAQEPGPADTPGENPVRQQARERSGRA